MKQATLSGKEKAPPLLAQYRSRGVLTRVKVSTTRLPQKSRLALRICGREASGLRIVRPVAEARGYAGRVVRKSYAHAAPGERTEKSAPVKEGSIAGAGEFPAGLNSDGWLRESCCRNRRGCPCFGKALLSFACFALGSPRVIWVGPYQGAGGWDDRGADRYLGDCRLGDLGCLGPPELWAMTQWRTMETAPDHAGVTLALLSYIALAGLALLSLGTGRPIVAALIAFLAMLWLGVLVVEAVTYRILSRAPPPGALQMTTPYQPGEVTANPDADRLAR